MPRARRRRQSGRHRAHDELFGPPAGRSVASVGGPTAPGHPEPPPTRLRRLADDADSAGRPLEAIAQYERADLALAVLDEGLARQPDHIDLLLARGRAHGQQRHHQEAEADLRRLLRIHPSHGPATSSWG